MTTAGVYAITHVPTQRHYVGSTESFNRRFAEHLRDLRAGIHCNQKLLNAWRKYGEGEFVFTVLETTDNFVVREQYWIEELEAFNYGFNLAPIAGRTAGTRYTHSAEECARRSERWKQILNEDPARQNELVKRMKGNSYASGYRFTEEQKRKLAEAKVAARKAQ